MARAKLKICALDGCEETFMSHGRKAYHHEDCRKEAHDITKKKMHDEEHSRYQAAKSDAKKKTGSVRKIGVAKKFTVRGKIKYEGYTTL